MQDCALSNPHQIPAAPLSLLSTAADVDDCFEPHGRGEMIPFFRQIEKNKSALISAREIIQQQGLATVLGAASHVQGAQSLARQASEHSLRFMEAMATDLASTVSRKDADEKCSHPIAANNPVVDAIERTSVLMLALGLSTFSIWATMLGHSSRS